MADPWMKFYTSDWRNDPALKMCSMAARGLWIEMICLMHQATPYGHLLVNGQCPTDTQLAVLVGAPSDQIAALLGELDTAGIFSRTREGVIYSRKLSRMAKKAATARNNGRKGGNPSLGKGKGNPASDKGRDKGDDKPQKPEARLEVGGGVGAGASAPPGKPHPDDMTDEDLWDELLHIAGHRQGRVPTYWSPATAVIHIGRWRTNLGLTGSHILNTARQEQARDPDRPPPDGPKAFDKAMQRLAAELQADPLTPGLKAISGGRQNDRRQFAEAHREYTRRLASGAIDRGPDESDPFAQ